MLLQDTVTRAAERHPETIGLVDGDRCLTYGALDDLTSRLATLLKASGCRAGDRVGLLLPKSVEAIAALLGTLKAGCIYVPMDLRSPPARLAKILSVCEPALILGAGDGANLLRKMVSGGMIASDARVGWLAPEEPQDLGLPVDFRWPDLASAPPLPQGAPVTPDAPAHILFTSGSTGVPKGVVITHSNVAHFLKWATGYFGTSRSDRISCHPPLHFDLSTFDVFGTFLAGAELHLVPAEKNLLPHDLAGFIRAHRLTQWFSVPSALKFMAQFDVIQPQDFPQLKRVLWCGEALPTPTLIYWMRRLPGVQFTNLYGPTETTIASSYYTVPRCPEDETRPIPIGVACAGEELLVLDESLTPAAAGESGELYIGGTGLSPGYWRDEEKTRLAFLTDSRGNRVYKTGDLGLVDADGLVHLLGRSDSQIKSRGYRIELGEIESALHTLGSVGECAVVALPSHGFDGTAICCAYVPATGVSLAPPDLRQKLSELVPPYMLPSRWMRLDALPLNANGKIDRPRVKDYFGATAASA